MASIASPYRQREAHDGVVRMGLENDTNCDCCPRLWTITIDLVAASGGI